VQESVAFGHITCTVTHNRAKTAISHCSPSSCFSTLILEDERLHYHLHFICLDHNLCMPQQKRASAPKPELDRRQLILRLLVDEKGFQKRLSKTVISRGANPAGLDTLISALGQLGFDVASATREVDVPALRHCIRCHVDYDPRDNPNDACKIRHDQTVEADLVSPTYKHGSVMYFGCCEQKLDLEYIEEYVIIIPTNVIIYLLPSRNRSQS
jgi:hypothetical protein